MESKWKEKFDSEEIKRYFEKNYRLTFVLAIQILDEKNRNLEDPGDWPGGQEWDDLAGSSQASFMRLARERLGLDDQLHKYLLRNIGEAAEIADRIRSECGHPVE